MFTLNYIQTFTSAIKRFMVHSIHFKCPVYQFLMHWFALWLAVLCVKKGNCPIARKQVHFVIGLVDSVLYAWQTGKWSILQEFKSQKYFKTSVLNSWYIHVDWRVACKLVWHSEIITSTNCLTCNCVNIINKNVMLINYWSCSSKVLGG